MARPELEDESIRIIRTWEASHEGLIEVTLILLVHVTAICRANSQPAGRIDSDTANGVDRIVVKGIRGAAAGVNRGARFTDQLDVFVDYVVDRHARQELVRTIQQNCATHCIALRI